MDSQKSIAYSCKPEIETFGRSKAETGGNKDDKTGGEGIEPRANQWVGIDE